MDDKKGGLPNGAATELWMNLAHHRPQTRYQRRIYSRRALKSRFFPELWDVRIEL